MADAPRKEKKWFPLESNPDVMNKYLARLGVDLSACPVEFCDVFGLEPDLLMMVPTPAAALLLVYPINETSEKYNVEVTERTRKMIEESAAVAAANTVSEDDSNNNSQQKSAVSNAPGQSAFFMKQTISNACGTIAALHAIANNTSTFFSEKSGAVKTPSFLSDFIEKTKNMTPEQRAEFIEKDDSLEEAQAVAASEGQTSNKDIDEQINLHFVCFTRSPDGYVVELDGRKPFAIPHGKCEKPEDFLPVAAEAAKKFISMAGEAALSSLAITALAGKM